MNICVDPKRLGIIPPMDLSFGDPQSISPFPLKLRTHDNSRPTVGSIGLFGARRNVSSGFIRLHEGVDLLAPIGTKVFAVQDGKVIDINRNQNALRVEHVKGFRYSTFYSHLQNIRVAVGDDVKQGEEIAEIGDYGREDKHLHFEISYPFNRSSVDHINTLRVNPTWALYEWEKKRFTNDTSSRNVIKVAPNDFLEFSEIVRGRLLRFIKIRVKGFNQNIYLPFGESETQEKFMAETLRMAFINKVDLEITWRESLYFNQIEYNFNQNNKIAILVEIKLMN